MPDYVYLNVFGAEGVRMDYLGSLDDYKERLEGAGFHVGQVITNTHGGRKIAGTCGRPQGHTQYFCACKLSSGGEV